MDFYINEYDLAIEEFTTNYDVNSTNEELQSDLSLYTFQEYYISGAVEADAFPITFDYLVISPLNDFHTFDSTLEDNQMKISETLVLRFMLMFSPSAVFPEKASSHSSISVAVFAVGTESILKNICPKPWQSLFVLLVNL